MPRTVAGHDGVLECIVFCNRKLIRRDQIADSSGQKNQHDYAEKGTEGGRDNEFARSE